MHADLTDADIERIARGVTDLTLPKPEWTHGAHFALALWLLRRDEQGRTPALIRAYNEATGVPNTDEGGYHETITRASLRAARVVLTGAPANTPLSVLHAALMRSELGRSDWLFAFWSKPVLFSVAARRAWVAPDLKPLPYPEIAPWAGQE